MHGTCFIGLYIGRMDIPGRMEQVRCLTIKYKLISINMQTHLGYLLQMMTSGPQKITINTEVKAKHETRNQNF